MQFLDVMFANVVLYGLLRFASNKLYKVLAVVFYFQLVGFPILK
tara:strand:+ start:467 stop:598 length:132 start_codon:yes stop_codon:yes gene_type:complete